MAKTYSLSKKKVVEMISSEFEGQETVKLSDVLSLFEAKSSSNGGTTLVYDDQGDVIAKRCSYFGVFFAISEFGKRGDVYGYQSKLAESLVRKARSAAANAKKLADTELADGVIDVSEWREKLSAIAELGSSKTDITEIEDAPVSYPTAEEAKSALV